MENGGTKGSRNKGDSLFAMENIKKGNFIIEYVGKIVYEEKDSEYGMKIDGMDLWIKSRRKTDPSNCMNHSCEPNCVLEQWCVDGLPRMCFFANKDITCGEELTFHYN